MKVLYHANCTDGAGAALAIYLAYNKNDSIDFIPVQYGDAPPDVDGEQVYIVDFSYPRNTILEMATTATSITIIDHHETAQTDLQNPFPNMWDSVPLCDVVTIFNMNKSGAVLTWEFCTKKALPQFLLFLQDRDLWSGTYPETNDIIKGLALYPDWRNWQYFIADPRQLTDLVNEGSAINKYLDIQSDIITNTPPIPWPYDSNSIVPVYNLPGFMLSDTLHMALQKYPESPYAVGYFYLPDKCIYSLRSRKGGDINVSEIAKRHGGGGHKHSAGFPIKLT